MLFRTRNGELIEIKRYDFPTDKLYHQKIMEIKKSTKQTAFAKLEKTLDYKCKHQCSDDDGNDGQRAAWRQWGRRIVGLGR